MNVFKAILDSIFPENYTCELCSTEIFDGSRFCVDCRKTVIFNDGVTCPVCGRGTTVPELCLDCKALAPRYDKAVSAFEYADGAAKLVLAFKKDRPYLKNYFAELLSKKCAQFTDAQAICFVPMTSKAQAKRGFNQAYLLAKELAKLMNLPLLKNAIQKVKDTAPQKSLTRAEREQNLKSCFKADRAAVQGKNLIVVDDVMTTGATADAVCGELKKRGAGKLYFATVASVRFKGEL
ncbi:MAG: double zinc ribbon domain-containing protein [Clostridia bacterium]|nr:double zinc ribbon domain-containing protein [Clostridia bacterium]